jgi:ATP-grasp ribosomal peptide maturase
MHGPPTATILVLTAADDPTADAVVAELDRRGAQSVRLDTGDFPRRMQIAAQIDGQAWAGRLWTTTAVDLTDVRSVYYRRPTQFRLPAGLSHADAVFATAEARMGVGGVLACLDALWVNDPLRTAAAEYKPLQLQLAARVGLPIPRTLITNDPSAAVAFGAEVGGPVVCKTLSSVLLADADGMKMTFTTLVDPAAIDPAPLAVTATLLQEWIPKAFDARVTMVGDQPFAVAIHTDSQQGRIDWRADYAALRYERIAVPPQVLDGMIAYLAGFGLSFGAFDFAVTPDGQWVMLECNPAGQWLWLEHETEAPIAASLADLLISGRTDDRLATSGPPTHRNTHRR